MQWSPKSVEVIAKHLQCKVTLLEGCVRSSKTYTADFIAMVKDIPRLPACNVLVSGFSSDSARQNIISEWEKRLNNEFKEHRDTKGTYYTISTKGLHNKRFYIRGGGKLGDEKGIKGITFGYWYGDEITEHTSEFLQMALTRLSSSYSKAIWTTNPSGPTNIIKKSYIDPEKAGKLKGIFHSFKFEIFDNPSLTKEYIRELELLYHGVFYLRNIKGKWVAAEGHIYTMLDDDNVVDYIPSKPDRIYIGIDYGTSNMTVFTKVYRERGKYYLVDEYDYSGEKSQMNKSPSEFVEELKRFIGKDQAKITAIYADPSANFFVTECKKAGIFGFKKATNDVIHGIQLLQNLFANKVFMFYIGCKNSLEQCQGYTWDKRAQERGEDIPVKKDDHYPDNIRYIMQSIRLAGGIDVSHAKLNRKYKEIIKNYD